MDKDENQQGMIRIIVVKKLRDELYKTFKKDVFKIYKQILELKNNPQKGKILGHVGNMSIRELKFKNYRFYFILDGHKLYLFSKGEVKELLIRFVKMSTKNKQQHTIDQIKRILEMLGDDAF